MGRLAYAYLRVSDKNEVDGNRFDRQYETIKGYAESHGFEIVETFREEGVSGFKDAEDRPAFKRMVSEILADGVRTVIIERLDRLAMDLVVRNSILAYLKSKDIILIDAGTGENVIEAMDGDPMRNTMVRVQAIFAELEKDQLVRKLKHARNKIREQRGRCEGPLPYGSTPEEAKVVRHILALRRTKRGGHRGLTFAGIADRLNKERVSSRSGGKWSAGMVHNILARGRYRRAKKLAV